MGDSKDRCKGQGKDKGRCHRLDRISIRRSWRRLGSREEEEEVVPVVGRVGDNDTEQAYLVEDICEGKGRSDSVVLVRVVDTQRRKKRRSPARSVAVTERKTLFHAAAAAAAGKSNNKK